MPMKKTLLTLLILTLSNHLEAQPDIGQILEISDSIVQVSVELENGTTGTGTGVVVTPDYVITNCHVLANGKGANVAKYGDGYKPIAMKADWKHDLCALKFDGLPFKPVHMRDSANLQNEEEIFTIGYPIGFNVPQPSFGNVKAKYPFEGSLIIRSDAPFGLGSSGGAMFDQQFNLIGITTFKSPGPNGYFYSLPVEWIKQLLQTPELVTLSTDEKPFWAQPLDKQPYFMKVVIPYQNQEWVTLNTISKAWSLEEPMTEDAWYFLALSEIGLNKFQEAKSDLEKVIAENPRHLDALENLYEIAKSEHDLAHVEKIMEQIKVIDSHFYEEQEKGMGAITNNP
jgi:serine protease Do